LGNYEVTKTAGSLSVTKAPLEVTANDATREYGTSNPVFTGTVTGGLSSDSIAATYATSADQTSDVGNYTIEATLVDPNNKLGNYEVTKTAGSLSITKASLAVTADDATREYGMSNPVFTGTVIGGLSSDRITATYATSADQTSDVGNYAIQATLVDPNNKLGNYEVTKTAGSLTVTKASLAVTADNATREYGTSNPVFTGTVSGGLSSDGITATYTTIADQASGVGSYAIETALVDPNNKLGNYEVTKTAGSLSVTKASLAVTADNATREYGTSNPVFTGTVSGGLSSDGITATYTTIADQASGVGSYAIETALVDPNNKLGNYEVTKTAGSLSVTKASLAVTADNATREYGTSNPVFTGTVSGGLSSDGITATYTTGADQASGVGNYAIEATLVDPNNKLGNYEVTKTVGSLSVTKAPLTVTPHTISRWLNNANPTLTGVVTGVLNNDDISAKYVTLAEQSSPIGNYTIEAEIIDPNQRLGNYEVTSNTAKLTVYDVPKLIYTTNDTASSIIGPLGLPATDDEGRSIQWISSNNHFVDVATGYVQRPSYSEGHKSVTLKATITADGATYEAIYPLIIIANSNTSSGVSYYIEVVSVNGKQRVELKLDDLKKGLFAIKSDSEVAEFMISKATLTQLMAISPSMKLQFITAKDEMTILIQEMAIAGNNHDLTIKIGRSDKATEFVEVKKSLGANVWAGPVEFNVTGLDDQGRSSEISAFSAYVNRKIELDAQDSDFATVVLWDEEKQAFTFVPAQFIKENGKVKAIVKSKRNGYFFVIDRRVSFIDLQNHWAKSDIELLAAKFIVQGRSEMNFDPNGMLTRAETAALLVRAIGIPLNNTEVSFSDVDGKWYEADVIAAEQAGLIKGYSDGTFRPNNRVTREELAVMLTRAIAYANPSLQTENRVLALADVEFISSWAEDSIYQALSLGIIKGDQQGNFKPQAEATRAEMVTLLSRMLKLLNFI
ncbi:MBG domain-containing protein, partial [Paenibacillus paridis]|uniref:MBG domain-containing protein n=1 Tax=Paenibacillus paridis TaxID=2583376 RepID=UPI00192E313D